MDSIAEKGALELKDLLDNPGTAAFSRLKYIPRYASDEQIAEFINGLFLAAANAKYEGDWEIINRFLEQWDEVGISLQYQTMTMPDAGSIPWASLKKPLDQCKIALVTTGGVFLEGQTPYSERGDATYREIPRSVRGEDFRIWHPGYDTGPASQDINCIFPIDRFRELEAEGVIGALAETSYSFMGLIPDPEQLIKETAPDTASRLKDASVDAVFLAST